MTDSALSPSDISIALATADDAEAVHALIVALAEAQNAAHMVTSTPDDLRRDGLYDGAKLQALLARKATGDAVGLALYYFTYSTWTCTPVLFVEDLYVDAGLRGSGLGKRLMAGLARIARDHGCLRVGLEVKTDNQARGFYERLGLVQKGPWLPYAVNGAAFHALADTAD
ncbi:MAG: GNAT family N-acetyltransferase [Alphaproteobacteria bacterium]|nr:GNAT family N-acetyltransferase [Alphaproteobacteria bacterium]